MTLIDSSVWSAHLVKADAEITELIQTGRARLHPMVLGELSLSPFRGKDYEAFLTELSLLEAAPAIEDAEVLGMIQRFRLWGRGIGWVDCHLLASARAMDGHLLTKDRALKAAWALVRPQGR